MTVTAANQAGTALTIGVPFTTAGGGILTLEDNGTYTFAPGTAYNGLDANETATETITYTVSDGNGGTDTATLVITIVGANDAPVVIDPANPGTPENPIPATDPLNIIPDVTTSDGTALTPIVVSNFVVDPYGEPLVYTLDPATTPAWLSIDPDTGAITGTPPADASQLTNTGTPGEYLLTITATDPDGTSVITTVTLSILNLPPVAVDDAAPVGEDAVSVSGNLITDPVTGDADTAPDSDPLTVTAANQAGNALTIGVPFTTAGGGILTLEANGTYTFAPGTAYNGLDAGETATETISYTVSDGNGGTDTATLVITIVGANDAPVIIDPANPGTPDNPIPAADPLNIIPDVATTDGTALTPIVVSNFVVDPDGEPLVYTLDPATTPAWLSIDPDTGAITGTPPADASQLTNTGTPGEYLLTITATDPDGASVTTTVTLSILNLPPVAVDDAAPVGEDAVSVSGNLITDPVTGDADTAPDSDPLTVTAANQAGTALTIGVPFTTAGGGILTLEDNGTYTFAPGTAYNGLDANETATETITYTVSDGNGGTDTATLVITIVGANDAPVVIDPANPGTPENPIPATDPLNIIPDVTRNDGQPLTPIVVSNFVVDPDGEPLVYTLDPATTPAWLSIDPDTGAITGTPPADASQLTNTGTPGEYLLTITATDPDGASVTTTVTLSILNPPPVAVDDTAVSLETGRTVVIKVLANDRDGGLDRDSLSVVSAVAQHGTVTVNRDGTISYIADPGYEGNDVITYTISDGQGGTATARVPVVVQGVAMPPVDPTGWEPAEVIELPPTQQELQVDGIVLDTVSSLTNSQAINTRGIILDTVRQSTGNSGIHVAGIISDVVTDLQRSDDTTTGPAVLHSSSEYAVKGLQSFSLVLSSSADSQIKVETFVHDQKLFITLDNELDVLASSVLEWKAQRADGRPLPDWLSFAGNNLLMGERAANEEEMDLRIICILRDGASISNEIRINSVTGEVQPLKINSTGADTPKMFWDQLNAEPILTEGESRELGRALIGGNSGR